jgi:hypothetical protein
MYLLMILLLFQADQFQVDVQTQSVQEFVVDVTTENAEPKAAPSITFEAGPPAKSGIVETKATVKERWLVSEPWCPSCPAAKKRFIASGGKSVNIITIAKALELHGRVIDSVPREYTTDQELTLLNPAQYRSAGKMEVLLEGSSRPGKGPTRESTGKRGAWNLGRQNNFMLCTTTTTPKTCLPLNLNRQLSQPSPARSLLPM